MSEPVISAMPDDAPRGYYGADGQPQFFNDAGMDRFVAVLMKLTQEFWVLSERLDSIERLLQGKQVVSTAEIKALLADPQVMTERDAALAEFIARTLGPLREP
jgi:hypothetical protein